MVLVTERLRSPRASALSDPVRNVVVTMDRSTRAAELEERWQMIARLWRRLDPVGFAVAMAGIHAEVELLCPRASIDESYSEA